MRLLGVVPPIGIAASIGGIDATFEKQALAPRGTTRLPHPSRMSGAECPSTVGHAMRSASRTSSHWFNRPQCLRRPESRPPTLVANGPEPLSVLGNTKLGDHGLYNINIGASIRSALGRPLLWEADISAAACQRPKRPASIELSGASSRALCARFCLRWM